MTFIVPSVFCSMNVFCVESQTSFPVLDASDISISNSVSEGLVLKITTSPLLISATFAPIESVVGVPLILVIILS